MTQPQGKLRAPKGIELREVNGEVLEVRKLNPIGRSRLLTIPAMWCRLYVGDDDLVRFDYNEATGIITIAPIIAISEKGKRVGLFFTSAEKAEAAR